MIMFFFVVLAFIIGWPVCSIVECTFWQAIEQNFPIQYDSLIVWNSNIIFNYSLCLLSLNVTLLLDAIIVNMKQQNASI